MYIRCALEIFGMKVSDNASRLEKATEHSTDIRILLVDDDPATAALAREPLEAAGFSVLTAVDGFQALAKVVTHRPSLIFLDIMTARIDGYQTSALIKNNVDYRDIPVVLMHGEPGVLDATRARIVGIDDCMLKPFTGQSLLERVQRHVSLVTRAKTARPSSTGHAPVRRAGRITNQTETVDA